MNKISHTSDKIYRIIKPVGQITKKKTVWRSAFLL